MKRKSFSVFFWISVVLVAVLLFFVMGRTVEGFLDCPGGDAKWCSTLKCVQNNRAVNPVCDGNYRCKCPQGSKEGSPIRAPSVQPACPNRTRRIGGTGPCVQY
jgi:hypothetical protein